MNNRNRNSISFTDVSSGHSLPLRHGSEESTRPREHQALSLPNFLPEGDNDFPEFPDLKINYLRPPPDFSRGRESECRPGGSHELLPPRYFPSSASSFVFAPASFDVDSYQRKKTLAQGMMDLALISANANQLRYVLQVKNHPYYVPAMSMIILSLILQVVVGVGLIWNSKYDVKEDEQVHKANKTNNWTVVGIFLVTILNVFISSFGVNIQNGVHGGYMKISSDQLDNSTKGNNTCT